MQSDFSIKGKSPPARHIKILLQHAQCVTFRQEPAFRIKVGIAQSASRIATTEFVAGIYHSKLMVEEACKRNEPAISNGMVELKQGDVARLPYEDDSFEKAFSATRCALRRVPRRAGREEEICDMPSKRTNLRDTNRPGS